MIFDCLNIISIISFTKASTDLVYYKKSDDKTNITIDLYTDHYINDNYKKAIDYCSNFYDKTTGNLLQMNKEINKYFRLHQRRFPIDQILPQHMKISGRDLISETFKNYIKNAFFDKKLYKYTLNSQLFDYFTDEEKLELYKNTIKTNTIITIIENFEENKGETNREIVVLLADHIVEGFKQFDLDDKIINRITDHLKDILLVSENSCEKINTFLNEKNEGRLDYLEYFGFVPANNYLKTIHWAKNLFSYWLINKQTELPDHLSIVKFEFEILENLLKYNFIEKISPDLAFINYSLIMVELLSLDKCKRKPTDEQLELFTQLMAHIELFELIIGYIHDLPFLLRNQGCIRFSKDYTKELIDFLHTKNYDKCRFEKNIKNLKKIKDKFTTIINNNLINGLRPFTYLLKSAYDKYIYKKEDLTIRNLITLLFLSTYKYNKEKIPEKTSSFFKKLKSRFE